LLIIFAIQLLFVTLLVAALEYFRDLNDAEHSTLDKRPGLIVVLLIAALVLLFALYKIRKYFPWNWVCLLAFSIVQSLLFASLGVLFKTNVGVINCVMTFVWALIMIALSGVRWKSKHQDGESKETKVKLLNTFLAGVIGYVIVGAGVGVIYAVAGDDFLTKYGIIGTLLFQLVLLLWFAHDAAKMHKKMTPDEYMYGVIYFYSDMILLLALAIVVAFGDTPIIIDASVGNAMNHVNDEAAIGVDDNA
jgi:hypothetical protein